MNHLPSEPGTQLMQQVRAGFILQGITYTEWCRREGVDPSIVRQAIYGNWAGPKGRAIKAKVLRAAGIDARAAA